MATIYREFIADCTPEHAWDALRDFGALHTRLVKGFVTDCTLEGNVRSLTFANGMQAKEQLVGLDETNQRVCYTVIKGRAAHHHASAQVFAHEGGKARLVWITDLLPHELAAPIGGMMDLGVKAMQQTLAMP